MQLRVTASSSGQIWKEFLVDYPLFLYFIQTEKSKAWRKWLLMLRKNITCLKAFFKYQLSLFTRSHFHNNHFAVWGCTHAYAAVVGWPCLGARCPPSSSLPALLRHRALEMEQEAHSQDSNGRCRSWVKLVGSILGPAGTSFSGRGNIQQLLTEASPEPHCYQKLATQVLCNRTWQNAAHTDTIPAVPARILQPHRGPSAAFLLKLSYTTLSIWIWRQWLNCHRENQILPSSVVIYTSKLLWWFSFLP